MSEPMMLVPRGLFTRMVLWCRGHEKLDSDIGAANVRELTPSLPDNERYLWKPAAEALEKENAELRAVSEGRSITPCPGVPELFPASEWPIGCCSDGLREEDIDAMRRHATVWAEARARAALTQERLRGDGLKVESDTMKALLDETRAALAKAEAAEATCRELADGRLRELARATTERREYWIRAEQADAKLAKAVEALETIAYWRFRYPDGTERMAPAHSDHCDSLSDEACPCHRALARRALAAIHGVAP